MRPVDTQALRFVGPAIGVSAPSSGFTREVDFDDDNLQQAFEAGSYVARSRGLLFESRASVASDGLGNDTFSGITVPTSFGGNPNIDPGGRLEQLGLTQELTDVWLCGVSASISVTDAGNFVSFALGAQTGADTNLIANTVTVERSRLLLVANATNSDSVTVAGGDRSLIFSDSLGSPRAPDFIATVRYPVLMNGGILRAKVLDDSITDVTVNVVTRWAFLPRGAPAPVGW